MRRNRTIYFSMIIVLALASCIKPYEPVIESNDAVKFVVSGQVVKGSTLQHLNISVTSPINNPAYIPVAGCQVTINDDKGNSYLAVDRFDGDYDCFIPESNFTPGVSYMVNIVTPGGVNIVSDFDRLNECPEVDSVYFMVKDVPSTDPEVFKQGIQFYVNLDAQNSYSRYFRWEAFETWEYHSSWPIEWYYDGVVHHVFPPDYSRSVCWQTQLVKNIFTLSTANLEQNMYNALPLHFVNNFSSPRLVYGYSLLLKQFALSEAAYSYWEKLRINSTEQGGLYDKQPLAVSGNLHNVTNPEQSVLGFFEVTEMKSKRIFIQNVENLAILYDPGCAPGEPMRGGFKEVKPWDYPFYLYGNEFGYSMRELFRECVDCLSVGGTNVKPAFWPN